MKTSKEDLASARNNHRAGPVYGPNEPCFWCHRIIHKEGCAGVEIDRLRSINAELLAALKGAMFFVPIGTKARDAGNAACDRAES